MEEAYGHNQQFACIRNRSPLLSRITKMTGLPWPTWLTVGVLQLPIIGFSLSVCLNGGTIDTLPAGPADATLAAVGALVHGGTFVADAPNLSEVTVAVFAPDGALGRAVVLSTENGVPTGPPLWQGPDILWPLESPGRGDGLWDLVFRPNVALVPGDTYFVGIDFGLFGAGTPGQIYFVGATFGDPIPQGRAWGYIGGGGWDTLGPADTDIAARIVMTQEPGRTGPEIVYSNFGAGMAFDSDPFHGWTINGFLGENIGQQGIAHRFTPTDNNIFTSAVVALSLFTGPGVVNVFLQAEANGLPGQILEEISLDGLTDTPTILTATSILRPQLVAGTPYWLGIVAAAPGVVAGWHWNSIGETSTGVNFAGTQGGSPTGPWALNFPGLTRAAFQINGRELTPQEDAELLAEDIDDLLQNGTLTQEQAEGLTDKLEAFIASLDRANVTAACNKMQAFINQVNGLVGAGQLPTEDGENLRDSAEDIIGKTGC